MAGTFIFQKFSHFVNRLSKFNRTDRITEPVLQNTQNLIGPKRETFFFLICGRLIEVTTIDLHFLYTKFSSPNLYFKKADLEYLHNFNDSSNQRPLGIFHKGGRKNKIKKRGKTVEKTKNVFFPL